MDIRKAEPADFGELLNIWLRASRVGHPFLGEEVLQEQLPRLRDVYIPMASNWVAEDERIRGFIGLIDNHIGGLFVSPDAHRMGVGRKLIAHAAQRLGELSVEVYELNRSAVAFYRNCGFEEAGRKGLDDEGRPFPLLRLTRPGAA